MMQAQKTNHQRRRRTSLSRLTISSLTVGALIVAGLGIGATAANAYSQIQFANGVTKAQGDPVLSVPGTHYGAKGQTGGSSTSWPGLAMKVRILQGSGVVISGQGAAGSFVSVTGGPWANSQVQCLWTYSFPSGESHQVNCWRFA